MVDEHILKFSKPMPSGKYFIEGTVDFKNKVLILIQTGENKKNVYIPFSWFKSTPEGPEPDFYDFEIIDSGQTIRLGYYEAASDTILDEFGNLL
jgi:hypothetical protein